MRRSIIVLLAILSAGLAFGKDIEVEDGVMCIYGDVVIPNEFAPKACLDANLQALVFWDYGGDPETYQATRMWVIDPRHEKIGFSEWYGPDDPRNDRTEGQLYARYFSNAWDVLTTFSGYSCEGTDCDGNMAHFTGGYPGTASGTGGAGMFTGAPGRGGGNPGFALLDAGEIESGAGVAQPCYVGAYYASKVLLGHTGSPVDLNGATLEWTKSPDPDKPAEGKMVIWEGDGSGWCPDGDTCIARTESSVTKRDILHGWSSGSTWP